MKTRNIKEEIYKVCEEQISLRIVTVEKILKSIEESRNNETKSSAGDKYETGRAMMQMEEEKAKNQLLEANRVMNDLSRIDLDKISTQVEFGSLVKTSNGIYYISVGVGKVTINDQLYYCVSMNSPIGLRMMSNVVGDEVEFKGRKMEIQEIC